MQKFMNWEEAVREVNFEKKLIRKEHFHSRSHFVCIRHHEHSNRKSNHSRAQDDDNL